MVPLVNLLFFFNWFITFLLGRILQLPRGKGHKGTSRSYSKVPHGKASIYPIYEYLHLVSNFRGTCTLDTGDHRRKCNVKSQIYCFSLFKHHSSTHLNTRGVGRIRELPRKEIRICFIRTSKFLNLYNNYHVLTETIQKWNNKCTYQMRNLRSYVYESNFKNENNSTLE